MDAEEEGEWVQLQSAGTQVKELHARLLHQYDSAWELSDEQMDTAAYEALLLTFGMSYDVLRQSERETLEYVRQALAHRHAWTRSRQQDIIRGISEGGLQEPAAELGLDDDLDHLEGWLEKAGEKNKSFKTRWFVLDGTQIEYYDKPEKVAKGKSNGTIDLETADACEQDPMNPLTMTIRCPTRAYELRVADGDPFTAGKWHRTITNIIEKLSKAKEGTLEKQGNKNKAMKARYFRLLGMKLYYYKKPGEKPAGSIDLREATGCRADEDDAEKRTFKILCPGRAYILRAPTHAECVDWVSRVHQANNELSGMDGHLMMCTKRGKKLEPRWVTLRDSNMNWYKEQGQKSETGSLILTTKTSCHMDDQDSESRSFVVEQGGRVLVLQGESESACREWICAIFERIQAAADTIDDQQDFDEAELPSTHLVDYRLNLLMEKRPQHFACFADFLLWRKRQLVVFASAVSWQLDHHIGKVPSAKPKLEAAKTKIFNQTDRILKASIDMSETDHDDADYEERLIRIQTVFADAVDVAQRVVPNAGDNYFVQMFPLHVSTLFFERLMRCSCFEDDDDYGGGFAFQVEEVLELFSKLGRRLYFVGGVLEILYMHACVEQHKLKKDTSILSSIQEVLRDEAHGMGIDTTSIAPRLKYAEALLLNIQRYCNESLRDYHLLTDPSDIAIFADIFVGVLKLRAVSGASTDAASKLENMARSSVERHFMRVKDEVYLHIIFTAVDPQDTGVIDCDKFKQIVTDLGIGTESENWDRVFKQIDIAEVDEIDFDQFVQFVNSKTTAGACGPAEKPMTVLTQLANRMIEELDREVAEHSAYLATQLPDAQAIVASEMAKHMNEELTEYFFSVDEISSEIMDCWDPLRRLEAQMIAVMEDSGCFGKEAKILKLDAALEDVAIKWVEDKKEEKMVQMNNCLANETWSSVSQDQNYAVSALDVVSMLLQFAKQYFEYQLPVAESVVKKLAAGFGFVLQQYGRRVLQDCGQEQKPPWVSSGSKKTVSMLSLTGGKDVKAGFGRLRNKTAGALGIDSMEDGATEPSSEADPHQGIAETIRTIESICIRLSTLDYIADRCADLCSVVLDGCSENNYTGEDLENIMEEPMKALKQHAKSIAERIASQIVFFEVDGFYGTVYTPQCDRTEGQSIFAKVSLSELTVFDQLDEFLGTIMGGVPDDCRFVILEGMLENCVQIIERRITEMKRDEILLQLSDTEFDIIASDTAELRDFFIAGGEGLPDETADQVTRRLGQLLDELKVDAERAVDTGKISRASASHRETNEHGFSASNFFNDDSDEDDTGDDALGSMGSVVTKGIGGAIGKTAAARRGSISVAGNLSEKLGVTGVADKLGDRLPVGTDKLEGIKNISVSSATGVLSSGLSSGAGALSSGAGALMNMSGAKEVTRTEHDLAMGEQCKIQIKPNCVAVYHMPVKESDGALMWEFAIEKDDLQFSVSFTSYAAAASEQDTKIEGWDDSRHDASEGGKKGMYAPEADGTLNLEWNNAHSLIRTRTVSFRVRLMSEIVREQMEQAEAKQEEMRRVEAESEQSNLSFSKGGAKKKKGFGAGLSGMKSRAGAAAKAAGSAAGKAGSVAGKASKVSGGLGKMKTIGRRSAGACDYEPGTALECVVPTAVTAGLDDDEVVGEVEEGDSIKVIAVEVDQSGEPLIQIAKGWVHALTNGKPNFQKMESFF